MRAPLILILCWASVSLPDADQAALANSLIVGTNQDLTLWKCKVCCHSNQPRHSHSIENDIAKIRCITSVYQNHAVLAFRYTNCFKNVWQDILYPFQVKDEDTCPECKVQREYNKMWNLIRDNVTLHLGKMQKQTGIRKLILTGISLGGGLAGIAFVDINHKKIFEEVQVVTFGAPKVGNKFWANFFDQKTNRSSRRYILKGDPVAHMPECITPFCNYKHTGMKLVCRDIDKTCRKEKEIEQQKKFNLLSVEPQYQELEVSILDHIRGYPNIYNYTVIFTESPAK